MKTVYPLLVLFFFFSASLQAAIVDTLQVESHMMHKPIEVIVIAPQNQESPSPVIYLLHGYSGNAQTWIGMRPDLPEIADKQHLTFVCPDGNNSWYWDSPQDPSYCYETFVSKELVSYIDSHYATIKAKEARAITGLSMGGHGALWLAFRHTDVFGAAGSTSGGVDIRPFPKNWEMRKHLGEWAENKEVWDKHTVINLVDQLKKGDLALIIDCGYDDFFFDVNTHFHARLVANKIDHDFLVRPGGHTAAYWKNSIDYQILFFQKFFSKEK
ncbi:esterase family protein [Parabacteroides sp. 52]|uniref:alpha/beta hydrolase n=1 Tax=unclassified Parabacteroides TaxID=2649774 RepID=UPI0013D562E2|nr:MULTISPECIES: alpha/beta hydrolase family protein [unclassified Parabacteroides]NDV55103.1 esterase family protein [Parabacteroides sp. 52]